MIELPPEIETVELYFFGCWEQPGHYWLNPRNRWANEDVIMRRVPAVLHRGKIDAGFCPGYVGPYKRDRQEVEGAAALHHIDGWTVLAWWDRSIDGRGGCNSALVALGLWNFAAMLEIGRAQVPRVIERQRVPIRLVVDRTAHAEGGAAS